MTKTLPPGNAATLALVHPTSSEQHTHTLRNSREWRGALALDAYVRREHHLADVGLTPNGGITFWILVDAAERVPAGRDRTVLAGCETLRKRALVARHGALRDATCHGVASVFCPDEYRGMGYGVRMMAELGERLEAWQREEGRPYFSVLFSDIGKAFYAKSGWMPYTSAHMLLPPLPGSASVTVDMPQWMPLTASDVPPLCALDEELLRARLSQLAAADNEARAGPAVALIPDAATMAWHHAREDFVSKELFGEAPVVKGAQVLIPCSASPMGRRRAWGIWTRVWNNADTAQTKGNTLHLLRICIEPPPTGYDLERVFVEDSQTLMAVLSQAQRQAAEWSLEQVEVWNPAPATRQAIKLLAQDWSTRGGSGSGEKWGVLVDRDSESICCLRWYGEKGKTPAEHDGTVNWLEAEKYCWC